jgi:Fic family protein
MTDRPFVPKLLPLSFDIETKEVLKKTARAHQALAKLDGIVSIIPNRHILINSLVLQEAKESSEIENIITTHDELYKAEIDIHAASREAKEVQHYREALLYGYEKVRETGLLLKKDIVAIQKILEGNDAGIRTQSGTVLRNARSGEVVFTPPQDFETIDRLMENLEQYINNPSKLDPLVDMAIIHYQFETIHPFYDRNGRTGRIINILYLVKKELLEIPVLYLSRYIIRTKVDYYRILQEVRTKNKWEEWVLYMLEGVIQTSYETICLIEKIKVLMDTTKRRLREEIPKIYSKDLLEILFKHPYTKIEFLVNELHISRQTASTYLKKIEEMGLLKEMKLGRSKYFINLALFELLRKGVDSGDCK